MPTRTVTITLEEQNARERTLRFIPDLTSADDELVLQQAYRVTTDEDGTATIDLPTKTTGSIRYKYEIPSANGVSKGYANLSDGAAIDLHDWIVAGTPLTDSVQDYIDGQFADPEFSGTMYADAFKALDTGYTPILSTDPPFVIGSNDALPNNPGTVIVNNTHWIGELFDVKIDATGAAGKILAARYSNFQVTGDHTNSSIYGAIETVSNRTSNGNALVVGRYLSLNIDSNAAEAIGTEINVVKGSANTTDSLTAFKSAACGGYNTTGTLIGNKSTIRFVGGGGGIGTLGSAYKADINIPATHTLNEFRGLDISDFTQIVGELQDATGVHISNEIDAGTGDVFPIKSESVNLSQFAGQITVPSDPISSAWSGSTQLAAKGDLYAGSNRDEATMDYRRRVVHFYDLEYSSGDARNGWVVGQSQSGIMGISAPNLDNYPDAIGLIVVRMRTVATNAFQCIEVNSVITPIGRLGRGRNNWRYKFGFLALSDGSTTYTVYAGVGNGLSQVTPTRGCFFRYTHSVNSGNWEAVCMDSGGTTAVDTGVAPTADGALHTFFVEVNAAGTEAKFYIDDVLEATIATNISTVDNVGGMGLVQRSVGTGEIDIMVWDYVRGEWNFTTPRS